MQHTLTLYELNQLVRETIETTLSREYWVEAELSEAREVRGHCYMELIQKDNATNTPIARASAKCWKNTWAYVRPHFERITGQQIHPGMKVLLKVYANFHEAYGFSWIVTDINPEYTMGDMARKRQEIIRQLQQEGVFDLQRELRIPMFAQRIAVISSAGAAGYGDFCHQLSDNEYGLAFYPTLFTATMQGEGVEASVIAALNLIYHRLDDFDVVVIIRGGGATSDLSGFDTLALAENVANFPLPVITGIGHERDESVLDMISHTRVKTPTAAAAFLINHLAEVLIRVEEAEQTIVKTIERRMEMEQVRLSRLTDKIPMLFSLVKTQQSARLDRLYQHLSQLMEQSVAEASHRIDQLALRLHPGAERKLLQGHHRLDMLAQRAEALDPTLLLKRGYSITIHNGRAVRNTKVLKSGDEIETRFYQGTIKSIIK
ncbi:exodeoxyribonuclease VII, large subunit [Prevotella sp. DNF00663]|uniref:exodeoxyribonuclease VII large subunit n=1 Tax=Prevotella sp. DNF00663 TaxID=1384078 RepID=UPI000783EBAD|nr:exodeoxyribonuclease VII large subunit [Prevotella sp. DNF00663]KXB84751.1 exodeoxyribonuclease VII, large subunit [Prevotella sp. DNF00663]